MQYFLLEIEIASLLSDRFMQFLYDIKTYNGVVVAGRLR